MRRVQSLYDGQLVVDSIAAQDGSTKTYRMDAGSVPLWLNGCQLLFFQISH
jgi:hypothetical protein